MHDGNIHHHHHDDSKAIGASKEENIAMLRYMLKHNQEHATELHELSHAFDGEPALLLHESVHYFEHCNEKLAAALSFIEGE